MTSASNQRFHFIVRVGLAALLTVGLLAFLAGARLTANKSYAPTLSLRVMDTTDQISLPEPPPPAELEQPPPPEPVPDLPKLEIEFDSIAPPIKATLHQEVDLQLNTANFAKQTQDMRQSITFAASDLDSQPRLITRPSVRYPSTQRDRGVMQGKVTLEVLINAQGRVNIRRVLDSSHPEFTEMARKFAAGSRFTPPKLDGRPVNALFKWPLILRP